MKVGTLLECIESIEIKKQSHIDAGVRVPIKGEIYTIRAISVQFDEVRHGVRVSVLLEEIVNPAMKCNCGRCDDETDEPYFDICFFKVLPKINLADL